MSPLDFGEFPADLDEAEAKLESKLKRLHDHEVPMLECFGRDLLGNLTAMEMGVLVAGIIYPTSKSTDAAIDVLERYAASWAKGSE